MSSGNLGDTNLDYVLGVKVVSPASVIGLNVLGTESVEGVLHVTDCRRSTDILLQEMCHGLAVVENLITHDVGGRVNGR